MPKTGKSIIANPKGPRIAGVGKKRPGGMNFFGAYNIEGYNADFLYDNPNKREIGQLMLDMIYRIE